MTGVSFVVPVRNGAAHLEATIASIAAQDDGRPFEILAVDDRSSDGSRALLERLENRFPLRIVDGDGRGAAAAVNAGIRCARFPVVCQIDQDVVLGAGWLRQVLDALEDPSVGAAQGCYVTNPEDAFLSRLMAIDLEQRYAAITAEVDHVCTGNTAYRRDALHAVGLLDETMGYGYDNDLSYRLQAAGYRLAFCREARSQHRWRDGLAGYLVQQYGFGYGRLDVVARHPVRWSGDVVSPAPMMMHPLVMGVGLCLVTPALLLRSASGFPGMLAVLGATLLAMLALERGWAGGRAWRRWREPAALGFPVVHLMRDLAWIAACVVWLSRRLRGAPSSPAHSMAARRGAG
jgi:cellulose synthase/poly-beta-1,6-N-acetylglucosamine synthase-like glycosyltransferase